MGRYSLTWQCRGTPMGEVKMSLYSSTTLSIYCCRAEEPCLEAVAIIFFLPWGRIVRKTNFPIWEMVLLHYFVVIKEIMIGYEDKYIKWTTVRQGRDQDVSQFTNVFHTLWTKLGIKDSEKNLVLKYHGCLHRYIQDEMEFLDISSLGTTYRYAVKIEKNFKQKKRDFCSANPKQGKGAPKPQNKGQIQGGAT